MAASQSMDRQTFLANLRQSGLLSVAELESLESRLPDSGSGRVIARALVDQGILTKFQASRLLVGRTGGFVLSQYRILDELGKGGMGRVFKAVHQTMNRVVALKVLAPHLIETEKAQRMFLREMQTVARLMHPNLVTAYDANQVGDRYYLVMEYVDGPNLDQLVRQRGPLPVGQACEFVRQVAHGLQYASEMGMVHRDIKPSNLLVVMAGVDARRRQGQVKILDFGLARLQNCDDGENDVGTIITQPNSIMGTPDFVSPEQARNLHSVDIRSDLYSLGCTFYFLLTGQVPFPGGTTLEKLLRHSTEEPVPITQLRPDLPAEVSAIVGKLLAKERSDRFQTPAELAAALEPFAVQESGTWTLPRPQTPAVDSLATPGPASEGEASPFLDCGFDSPTHVPTSDEMAALVSTLPPDLSPTPLTTPSMPRAQTLRHAAQVAERKRIRVAIEIAVGVVSTLILLAWWFGSR